MIPRIIHYCWLSNDDKPESIQRCIASWKKHLPDYELRLWDINSFDYESVSFTKDALAAKKWPFVSDYIRLYALYNYGGIYLDSDVQVFEKLDDLLLNRFFTGLEMRDKEHTQIYLEGAIMGSEKGHPFVEKALDIYTKRPFWVGGEMDMTPIPTILSELMDEMYVWKRVDADQTLGDGIKIYSTKTIANSNCRRVSSVLLYHLNNRSWLPLTKREAILRSLRRYSRFLGF